MDGYGEYIEDVGTELLAGAVNGMAPYGGQWHSLEDWAEYVVEQETRKFKAALQHELNDVIAYLREQDAEDLGGDAA